MVARSFGDRPLFCDLLAHTPLNLERNVSPEAVRGYKLISLGAVGEAAGVVSRALPDLTEQECREFISAIAAWPAACGRSPTRRPRWPRCSRPTRTWRTPAWTCVPRLRRTAEILLAGLIPSRPAGPGALP